jgi:hypothetical protein
VKLAQANMLVFKDEGGLEWPLSGCLVDRVLSMCWTGF